jgi:hypothetical protein
VAVVPEQVLQPEKQEEQAVPATVRMKPVALQVGHVAQLLTGLMQLPQAILQGSQ